MQETPTPEVIAATPAITSTSQLATDTPVETVQTSTPMIESSATETSTLTPQPTLTSTSIVTAPPRQTEILPVFEIGIETGEIISGGMITFLWTLENVPTDKLRIRICAPQGLTPEKTETDVVMPESNCLESSVQELRGSSLWQIGEALSGNYQVIFSLLSGDELLLEKTLAFEISPAKPIDPLTLSLNLAEKKLRPGKSALLEWQLGVVEEGKLPPDLSVQICLPEGVTFSTAQKESDISNNGCLKIPAEASSASVEINAAVELMRSTVVILGALYQGETLLAETRLEVEVRASQTVEKNKGGEFSTENGKIKVKIGKDVLSSDAELEITSLIGDSGFETLVGAPIELKLYASETNAVIKTFKEAVVLELLYEGSEIEEDPDLYKWKYFDEKSELWVVLQTEVDEENKVICGFTTHFSAFEVETEEMLMAFIPPLRSADVSGYTGSATYSMPIGVPAGAGGYAPEIILSYNSQSVDSVSSLSQASEVGMGWNLAAGGRITRTIGKVSTDRDDVFSLVIGNIAYPLIPVSHGTLGSAYIEYKTQNDVYYSIRKYTISGSYLDYWIVYDKTGTK